MGDRRQATAGIRAGTALGLVALMVVGACAPAQEHAQPTPVLPPPATLPANETPPPATIPPDVEQPPPAPADARLVEVLQPLLDDWLAGQDVPGAVLGIRLADGRTAVVAAGTTDDVDGQSIEPGHRFRVGSITKTFVAVLALQLVEDGLVELDQLLGEHLPDTAFADQVTLRQLLSHTSGVPDFGSHPDYPRLMLLQPGRTWSARDVLGLVEDQPLTFEPGTRTAYSNTNYTLAALLAEEVTGQPLAELLRDRISAPAGLAATYLEELEPAPPMAVSGHFDINMDGQPDNVRGIPYTALVTSGAAAGGLSANALDMLDFAGALFDGQLLGEEMLAEAVEAPLGSYGLGIISSTRNGMQAYGHDGALPGFSAAFAYLPEPGVAVVAMANQTGAAVNALVTSALEETLAEP